MITERDCHWLEAVLIQEERKCICELIRGGRIPCIRIRVRYVTP